MNLTKSLRDKMVLEFIRGRPCEEVDGLYLQRLGTTEKLVREALKAQDGAVVHENFFTTPKDG